MPLCDSYPVIQRISVSAGRTLRVGRRDCLRRHHLIHRDYHHRHRRRRLIHRDYHRRLATGPILSEHSHGLQRIEASQSVASFPTAAWSSPAANPGPYRGRPLIPSVFILPPTRSGEL
jgi:hypothetical protein